MRGVVQRAAKLAAGEGGELREPAPPRGLPAAGNEVRALREPGLQVLFRPEEVGVASTPAAEDHRPGWLDLHDAPAVDDGPNALSAVNARV